MTRKLHSAVNAWLRSESVGASDAEAALREVYRAWPAPTPSRGFTRGVLQAAGLAHRGAWLPGWAWQWAFSIGLVLMLAAGAQVLSIVDLAGRAGWLAQWATGAIVLVGGLLADARAIAGAMWEAGGVLAGALDTPWTLGLCLVAVLLSAAAFLGLQSLLAWDRSSRYVHF